MAFPQQLANRIWHTTTEERFTSISNDGAILPEPNIPDIDRWGTAMGPEKHPFVRSIGGVSLFDFRDFQPEEYDKQYPNSSWREFVPCRPKNKSAVWIEIRLSQVDESFVDGVTLLSRWNSSDERYRKIMPLIECAHIGPIGTSAFGEVLVYHKNSQRFERA
jgi:hypothetical protein